MKTVKMQARDTGPLKPSRPPLSTTPYSEPWELGRCPCRIFYARLYPVPKPQKFEVGAGGARWARAQTSLLPYKAPPTPYVCAYYHFTVPPGARQNPDVVHAMACTEHAFHAPLRSSHVRHDTRLVRRITTRRGGARASARTRAVFHRPPPMAAPPRPAHLSVRGHFVEQLGAGLEQSGVSLRSQAEACARLRHMPRHLRSWEECAHVLELPGPRLATE